MNIRTQNLLDSAHARQWMHYNKRGWVDDCFRWELVWRKGSQGNWFSLQIKLGDSEDTRSIQLSLGVIGLSVYLTFTKLLPKKLALLINKENSFCSIESGWTFGSYLYNDHFNIMWKNKRWGCFLKNFIFGDSKYYETNEKVYKNIPIIFPEKTYHVDIKLTDDVWKYSRWPRWPLVTTIKRAHCSVVDKSGIVFPGKGENSYDCGDDGLFGLTAPAKNLDEAIQKIKESVYGSRKKYGTGPKMYVGKVNK